MDLRYPTIFLIVMLVLVPSPLVDADGAEAASPTQNATELPCYAVDTTTSPPRIYEVPCP